MKTSKKHYTILGFINSLSKYITKDSVIVTDAGQSFFYTTRDLDLVEGSRVICSYSQADMGFAIPASIGVYFACQKPVIVITGDGSFQLNLQELAVIKLHNLPIKIFVISNGKYESIRVTQEKFFGIDRYIGIDEKTGLLFPSIRKIANAYGIFYTTDITTNRKQVICEVICKS